MGGGAGRGGGGPVVRRPGGPAAGGQVVQDRAGGRLLVVEERRQGGVELLDGGRAGLEGGQGLPVAAGQPGPAQEPVEALVAAFQVPDAIAGATGAGGVITVNGVADALGVDQPRASRLVAGAVEAGLVRRGSDPGDGRRSVLSLTARGARALAQGHRARRAAVEAALAGWSGEDRATFARLLTEYVAGWERAAGRRD
ncbi:MAG TPA: MarR family winged helix-turn-helix transcriptional regulator [Actinomycetota bacterium]|nr:MarR family winged helix-turn-helix transcriptional regulator [Actinomycetota bacterium]